MDVLVATAGGLFEAGRGNPVAFEGRDVTAVARGPGEVWTIVDGGSLHRLDPGGSWRQVAADGQRLSCLLATDADALIGTSDSLVQMSTGGHVFAGADAARLLRLRGDRLEAVEGFDRAEGRGDWYTPWGGPPDTRSLSRGRDGTLYANVHVGGILRSSDGGATWEPTIDIHTDVHQVLAHPERDATVLAALGAGGLAISADHGGTWSFHDDGLHAGYCRAVAVANGHVLVTASESHVGRHSGLYRAAFGDRLRFERCETGSGEWFGKNLDTGWLAAAGDEAALATPDGSVLRSDDAGATWHAAAEGLPRPRWLVLIEPSAG